MVLSFLRISSSVLLMLTKELVGFSFKTQWQGHLSRHLALDKYHDLTQIYNWLHLLERQNANLKVITLGTSYEGRPVSGPESIHQKRAVFMDAGIHANEWIGPATMLYFINRLLGPKGAAEGRLDIFDWYILPVFNVDGYEYSWKHDRNWRKSRSQPVKNSTCRGVDLNRNWNFDWGKRGCSHDPCDMTFPGVAPFSEPELRAVRRALLRLRGRLALYLAFHSFSQLWMTPFAYSTETRPNNIDYLTKLGRTAVAAIKASNGSDYALGAVSSFVGAVSGSSIDYVYRKLGVDVTFGVELRDQGRYGMLLPANQIIPTAEEAWAGVTAVVQQL